MLTGRRSIAFERTRAGSAVHVQDLKGQRLTLYVRVSGDAREQTAFRFTQENRVGVFYWLDGRIGYALSGETDRGELLRVAEAVYGDSIPEHVSSGVGAAFGNGTDTALRIDHNPLFLLIS